MKNGAIQPSTMSEFVKLRSREKQATTVQQNEAELPKKKLQKATTCQVPEGKEKKLSGLQKKPQTVLPGSMALYLQMRKKQQLEKNIAGEKEQFCLKIPVDQNATQQDFEQDQAHGFHTDQRSPLLQMDPNLDLIADHRNDDLVTAESEIPQNRETSTLTKGKYLLFFFFLVQTSIFSNNMNYNNRL